MEDRKFVCKYCLKRFPCGKSLGGHIRTHMSEERNNAAASASASASASAAAYSDIFKFDCVKKKRDLASEEAVGGNGNPIYGLRENPKKTTRFVHSATTLENEMIKFCKECGKGFPSLKALCGHMASHSEKEKKIDKEKLVIDTDESDDDDDNDDNTDDDDDTCDTTTTMNLRKSKRMRFKSLTFSNLQSSSVNGSSSVSEVEQEQEEVAMCLMLLSKDFSQKGRFGSESSDNNSVVLETKSKASSHAAAKIVIRKNGSNKFVSNNDVHEFVENKKKVVKDMKLKSVVGIGVSNDSDSRNFRYSSKIKFLESSNASNCEFKRPKMEEEKSGFDDFRRSKCNVTMFKKSGVKDLDHSVKKNESTARKIDSRKKDNYEEGFGFKNNEKSNENGRKSWKYECFDSEKKDNDCYDYSTSEESDENSSESDSFTAAKSHHNNKAVKRKKSSKGKKKLKSKKSKEYECPICYKIFRSGQALGGHKRSHFVGGSEENTLVIKQGAPCLIDLNLPAPIDE